MLTRSSHFLRIVVLCSDYESTCVLLNVSIASSITSRLSFTRSSSYGVVVSQLALSCGVYTHTWHMHAYLAYTCPLPMDDVLQRPSLLPCCCSQKSPMTLLLLSLWGDSCPEIAWLPNHIARTDTSESSIRRHMIRPIQTLGGYRFSNCGDGISQSWKSAACEQYSAVYNPHYSP